MPLFKDVAKEWIEAKKPNLRANTFEVYQGIVSNHFADLEEIKIQRISTARVEKFIRERQAEGSLLELVWFLAFSQLSCCLKSFRFLPLLTWVLPALFSG